MQKGCRKRVIEQLLKKRCHCSSCVLLSLMIRPSESRTVPFYLETSLSFRCFGNLKRLLFIFLKESHCHAEAQLTNTILRCVCDSTNFMARRREVGSLYWHWIPNSMKLCPCIFLLFCCQHWRCFFFFCYRFFFQNLSRWKNSCWKQHWGPSPGLPHSSRYARSREADDWLRRSIDILQIP